MLTFKFSGADGVMTVAETLTSGMVGKQVKLEFTSDWDNLKKTAVFEAGDISEAVYNVGNTVAIPAAVLAIARRRLKIGIYGEDTEGNITPTIYAIGPRIEEGADPYRASGDPPMPKWKELEERIEDLEKGTTGDGSGSDSGQNGNGLSTTAANLLITILRNGLYSTDQSANITALATELAVTEPEEPDTPAEPDEPVVPEITLTSISAVYNGGDVAVGTAVSDLTGIVVTAHYSDGTSEPVTGYTLSGTIAEGSNTVTVSYGGKTTSFTVTGVAESGGEDEPERNAKYGLPNGTYTLDNGNILTITKGYHVSIDQKATGLYEILNMDNSTDPIFTIPAGSNAILSVSNKTSAANPNEVFINMSVALSLGVGLSGSNTLNTTNDIAVKTMKPKAFSAGVVAEYDVSLIVDGEVWI